MTDKKRDGEVSVEPEKCPTCGLTIAEHLGPKYSTNCEDSWHDAAHSTPPAPARLGDLIRKWRSMADKAEKHLYDSGMETENATHMNDMRMCADELEAAATPAVASKLTKYTCDCGRLLLVEGKVIGKEFLAGGAVAETPQKDKSRSIPMVKDQAVTTSDGIREPASVKDG